MKKKIINDSQLGLIQTIEDFQLFHSESGLIDFVSIEEDLLQLADYSRETLEYTKKKYNSIKFDDKEKYLESDLSAEDYDVHFEYVYNWEDNMVFLSPSLVMVSLYLFTEKSLKDLCYSFTPGTKDWRVPVDERFKVPKKHNESIVDASLKYLCSSEKFSFEIDQSYYDIFEKIRLLRNNFAHGDWENVRKILAEISVEQGFKIVSQLFYIIEKGMIDDKKDG